MTELAKTAVLEHLNTAVVVLSDDLTVCYMNPAAEAMLGMSEQRSAGARVSDLIQADNLDELRDLFTNGLTVTRRAAAFRTRDGHEVVADLTASVEPSTNRLVVELQPMNRLLRINRDEHSNFSQETTRKLVSGLAHEVKNPLGGLRGAAQLLERELDDEGLKEYTRIIIDEADRLKDLVDRMLGPNQEPVLSDVNVHALLEHVVRLVDAELPGQIRFDRDYDPSLPPIRGDEAQLIQALLNIISNAGQALEAVNTPIILLRTRAVRNFTIGSALHRLVAQIDIVDNGPGVEPDMLERMFFPMISGRPEGTGLGLAITQNIIGQHGGIIECESRPGQTCFSVFLPLDGPRDAAATNAGGASS